MRVTADRSLAPNRRPAHYCPSEDSSLFTPVEDTSRLPNEADPAVIAALPKDRWLLASLLQKTIRRGRVDLATAASALLADLVPEYVARRLPVIAYEDIGVAAPDLLLWTKRTSASLPSLCIDDRRETAARIAFRLAESVKSRTACDIISLLNAADETPALARELVHGATERWIAAAANRALPVIHRAVALHFALGLSVCRFRPSRSLTTQQSALPALAAIMNLPDSVVAAVCAGSQTHNLHAALPLAHDLLHTGAQPTIKAQSRVARTNAESLGMLLCAVDMYTRCGRNAYQRLIRENAVLRRLLQNVANSADPVAVVGMLLFHAEGSLLDRALVSPATMDLLAAIEAVEARRIGFQQDSDAEPVRQWLRDNIDVVEHHRTQALAQYLHREASVPSDRVGAG